LLHENALKGILTVFVAAGAAFALAAQAPAPAPAQDTGAAAAPAQGPAGAAQGRGGRGGRGRGGGTPAYPVRAAADPAMVQRGGQIFGVNCSFCHGSDARGGEGGGPNLIRSQVVLDDQNGEEIAKVVLNGRPDKGMPKFDLAMSDISAIAAFIHNFPVGGRAAITGEAVNPVVGDATAGQAYFNGPGKCATCHSTTGDLAGIGTKIADPRALQGAILSGEMGRARGAAAEENAPVKTVKVTVASGQTYTGKLVKVDDFLVSLVTDDSTYMTFARQGDVPKVVITNPLQPHLDMLMKWKDDDIHNLTAYLVTLK
jgi:cytochrome c oxidase cbb3-type subunit 3